MTNPATYLNTLWTQAGVPNGTEKFFKDALNSYDIMEKTTAAYHHGRCGRAATSTTPTSACASSAPI